MPKYKDYTISKKQGRRVPWKPPQKGYVVTSPRSKSPIIGSWRPTQKQAKNYIDAMKKEMRSRARKRR